MKELEQLLTASVIQDANWASDLLAHMSTNDDDAVEAANEACDAILAHPDAVAHPRWPELVEAAINASRDFEDVAEEVYGERISFEDDEGGLCQGFDAYSTTYSVAELLGQQTTRDHSQWFSLVLKLMEKSDCSEHEAPIGKETILPAVIGNHPEWEKLIPYLFGAGSSLIYWRPVAPAPSPVAPGFNTVGGTAHKLQNDGGCCCSP